MDNKLITIEDLRTSRHEKQVKEAIDQLLTDKKIVKVTIDGEEGFSVTARSFFEDLKDRELESTCSRELIYELESRGLLRLVLDEGEWIWSLTEKGQKSRLMSNEKAFHDVMVELGLAAVVERQYQMCALIEQTGL